jgi:hypothetical protein
MRTKLFAVLLAIAACDELPSEPAMLATPPASMPAPIPATPPAMIDAETILHELAPVPSGALVIVYDVDGPAGIHGTLETLVADGGRRRDNWQLSVPLPDGAREISGSRVRTPELRWHADGDDVGRMQPTSLATIAAAIAALDPVPRAKILAELQRWRAELAHARVENPGEHEQIAGVECTRVRAGGGEVCTWEELGVPLRYAGPALRVVARHIEHGAVLGPHAFDIPAGAVVEAPAPDRDDAPRLAAILAGDRAAIVRLLRPELDPLPGLLPTG